MYQIAEAFCQLSILAFYLRIATSPKLMMTTYILMGIVTCFGIGNTGAMMFQCQPISFFWDGWKGDTSGRCTVDIRLFGFIRGAIEIMLDEAILEEQNPDHVYVRRGLHHLHCQLPSPMGSSSIRSKLKSDL